MVVVENWAASDWVVEEEGGGGTILAVRWVGASPGGGLIAIDDVVVDESSVW